MNEKISLDEALEEVNKMLDHYKTFKNLKEIIESEDLVLVRREGPRLINTKLKAVDNE